MAFSCSLQPAIASSYSSSLVPTSLNKPRRLLGLKNDNNVLANFVPKRPHSVTRDGSTPPFAVKCYQLNGQLDKATEGQQVEIAPGLWTDVKPPKDLSRDDFPLDFKFGGSTSAIQTEGPGYEGGRGPSTWDSYIEAQRGHKASDSHRLFAEDIKCLKDTGMNAYRFSIAWPRIMPEGRGKIKDEGIQFYNKFINKLLENGITPVVTLFHFDLPVPLQNEYKGFLDRQIIEDFKHYADVCFKTFGDRVKHWTTINEPFVYGLFGYSEGLPCDHQRSELDPFIAMHNIILAHAAVTHLYHNTYQKTQDGKIGISLPIKWYKPQTSRDEEAQKRHLDVMVGWFMEPFTKGDYPIFLKESVKGLPKFTKEESEMVKDCCDFIGINYYTTAYSKKKSQVKPETGEITIQYVEDIDDAYGNPVGWKAPAENNTYVRPDGLRELLLYFKDNYNNPEIYITENGIPSSPGISKSVDYCIKHRNWLPEDFSKVKGELVDDFRISQIERHLIAVREAIMEGANVKGYFVWALIDNLETGVAKQYRYDVRFGLVYVDYVDDCKRYPKKSAKWFSKFLTGDANNGKLRSTEELEKTQELVLVTS